MVPLPPVCPSGQTSSAERAPSLRNVLGNGCGFRNTFRGMEEVYIPALRSAEQPLVSRVQPGPSLALPGAVAAASPAPSWLRQSIAGSGAQRLLGWVRWQSRNEMGFPRSAQPNCQFPLI